MSVLSGQTLLVSMLPPFESLPPATGTKAMKLLAFHPSHDTANLKVGRLRAAVDGQEIEDSAIATRVVNDEDVCVKRRVTDQAFQTAHHIVVPVVDGNNYHGSGSLREDFPRAMCVGVQKGDHGKSLRRKVFSPALPTLITNLDI